MALGPSIFLPCNHSSAFSIIYIFKSDNKDIKIVLTKIEFGFVILLLVAIVSK